jgi:predicted ATPase
MEQVIVSYDPRQHDAWTSVYGTPTKVTGLIYHAWAVWCLGYPDQALQHCQEAVALARELDHAYCLVYALGHGCLFHSMCREVRVVQALAQEIMPLSSKLRLGSVQHFGTFYVGWARAHRGELEEGIAQMGQGLAAWRSQSQGSVLFAPTYLQQLAEAYGMAGQAEKGLIVVEEALDLVGRTEERAWEAETHRRKGELLQLSGRVSEADTSFRRAIEIARRQEAKSWVLRANLSLSRLLQKEGRSEEARKQLSEIYGWFTEGFDTPDLKEARALLKELGAKGSQEPRDQGKRKKK